MSDSSQFGDTPEGWPPPPANYPPRAANYPPPPMSYQPPPMSYQPPPMSYPPPYGYPPQLPGYPPPMAGYPPVVPGYGVGPGYGFHPLTGEQLSDKSKVTAGLLQLPGFIFILGIGRIYSGQVGLGVAQLLVCLFAVPVLGFLTCGVGLLVPTVWTIVDMVVLMTGSPRDQYGRLLRSGT